MQNIKYIIGTPDNIIVDSLKFNELCKTGCKVYNTKFGCPPNITQFNMDQWLPFHIIILWMENNIESKNEYLKVKAINSILKSKLNKLLRQYPNKDVLGSGSCRSCQKCNFPDSCRYPNKMISSLEAHGVDVEALCKDLGHKLQWYKKGEKYKYGSVVGLIKNSSESIIKLRLESIILGINKKIINGVIF